jgi:hypothetical protein
MGTGTTRSDRARHKCICYLYCSTPPYREPDDQVPGQRRDLPTPRTFKGPQPNEIAGTTPTESR